jgi:hypothetical protein
VCHLAKVDWAWTPLSIAALEIAARLCERAVAR